MKLTPNSVSGTEIVPTGLPWVDVPLNGGFRLGGSYLLSGAPGSNKTTLALAAAAPMAARGRKALVVLTEQQPGDLHPLLERVLGVSASRIPKKILENLDFEILDNTADLLRLLRRVLPVKYPRTQLLIVDSIQGSGVPGSAFKAYQNYFAFCDEAKARNLITIGISHINKAGQIAGPKALEHKVDAALLLRKSYKFRHLYVVKNRFGPELVDPVVLTIETGRLELCPHSAAQCSAALGYGGADDELVEIQVAVSIPKLGARAELNAPFLPSKRMKQLVSTVTKLPGVELNELSYSINALIPAADGYRPELDLPIVVAMLSAYFQKPVSPRALFIGQIDLKLNIRSPGNTYMTALAQALNFDVSNVETVYLAPGAASVLRELMPSDVQFAFKVQPVRNLSDLINMLWPAITPQKVVSGRGSILV